MITANVIYRVFRLKVGLETGTAFTIEEGGGGEYLVTARHIAHSLQGECEIEVFRDGGWSPLQVTTVGHAPGDVDISVLAPAERLTPNIMPSSRLDCPLSLKTPNIRKMMNAILQPIWHPKRGYLRFVVITAYILSPKGNT